MKRNQTYYQGCLLGGAIGDAMGWPVEFKNMEQIHLQYGPEGITQLVDTHGSAEITDDTQMTLFTCEGLLQIKKQEHQTNDVERIMHAAYRRWLYTQGYIKTIEMEGELLNYPQLFQLRAPGNSCLTALDSNLIGTVSNPINNSKGCGGVMRMAPVGLIYSNREAFHRGIAFAALTHGHPTGYLASGAFAFLIAELVGGKELEAAAAGMVTELSKYANHEECSSKIKEAIHYAQTNITPKNAINRLGEGWIAEEALAIALYCALKYRDDFRQAIIVSVNHKGDSDSTGAICGNILGAYLGKDNIPNEWIEVIELREVIVEMGDALLAQWESAKGL